LDSKPSRSITIPPVSIQFSMEWIKQGSRVRYFCLWKKLTFFLSVVVAFRGTKPTSLENWIEDLNVFGHVDFPWYTDARVHPGFMDVLESHEDFLVPAVPDLIAQHPDYQVVITGHSLGAAVGTLFAMQLYVQFNVQNIHMVTFGSPRVGDQGFRDLFVATGYSHWRLTHNDDVVPHVPLELEGYIHVPGEIWEVEVNGQSSFTVCNDPDTEDPTCSDSKGVFTSIMDHKTYMMVTSGYCVNA
jgi:hypothetical protein